MPIPDLAEERANSVYILLLLEPILFTIHQDFGIGSFTIPCKLQNMSSRIEFMQY